MQLCPADTVGREKQYGRTEPECTADGFNGNRINTASAPVDYFLDVASRIDAEPSHFFRDQASWQRRTTTYMGKVKQLAVFLLVGTTTLLAQNLSVANC